MSQSNSKSINLTKTVGSTGIGAPVSKSSGINYYAETDGFASGWGGPGTKYIYSDASATPSTVVSQCWAAAGGGGDFGWVGAPIKKGNYWQVSSASYVMWEPVL